MLNRWYFAGASRWATEGLFEFVRWFHYPDRPERYGCIYGFESIDLAAGFIEKHRKEEGHSIYKCTCDPTAPVFRTDMDLFSEVNDLIINGQVQVDFSFENLFPKLLAIAKSYWQGPQNLRYPEILIKGSIQVLEQLT